MCDTLVALSNATRNNSILFAKNSDREPNEPQVIIRIPAKTHGKGQKVKCTYIEVEQKETTNEVILSKPSWIWGAEMGVNSKGLVIGNEAVFTKEKQEPEALLGMDMLRLALENCDDAVEAVEFIIKILDQYGQGGKAGYTANLRYHNSFIIADYKEAYVLETAGKHWILKQVEDVYSISNVLTLHNDFDKCSENLIENAIKKRWCKSKESFDFKSCYEDKLYAFGTQGNHRQKHTMDYMKGNKGNLDVSGMMDILRSHCSHTKVQDFKAGSMGSVCMHAGGIISSQTTGSLIVELKDGTTNLWTTASSLPCISLFKPLWFTKDYSAFFSEQHQQAAVEHWMDIEKLHRAILRNEFDDLSSFYYERDKIQGELMQMASDADTEEAKVSVMKYAAEAEKNMYDALSQKLTNSSRSSKNITNLYYNLYWNKQNSTLKG